MANLIDLLETHKELHAIMISRLSPEWQKVWEDIKDMERKPSKKLLRMLRKQYGDPKNL